MNNTPHRALECRCRLLRRRTQVLPDQRGAIHFDGVSARQDAQRAVELADVACHSRLARPRRSGEDHVVAVSRGGKSAGLTFSIDDHRRHLLLQHVGDPVQPRQCVQLRENPSGGGQIEDARLSARRTAESGVGHRRHRPGRMCFREYLGFEAAATVLSGVCGGAPERRGGGDSMS